MILKFYFGFLLFFVGISPGFSDFQDQKAQSLAITPQKALLWKIHAKHKNPSYLFGTIHLEDERVVRLPPPVDEIFTKAQTFVMEVVMDFRALNAITDAMYYQNGQTLAATVGSTLYSRSAQVLKEYGMAPTITNSLKPWAVVMILSAPKAETGDFLDKVLYENALRQNKKVSGLETIAEQLSVMEGLSSGDQKLLLADTLVMSGQLPKIIEELIQVYLSRDLTALMHLNKIYGVTDKALEARMMQRMLYDRNHRMVKRMQAHLETGHAFIAVGALHLPGEQGIIQLLKNKSYAVTPIY